MKKNKGIVVLTTVMVVTTIFISGVRAAASYTTYLPIVLVASTPTPAPTITPTPTQPSITPTSPPTNTGFIDIIDIFYDGAGSSEPDEYVEIKNADNHPIQVQGWTLRDNANHVFTFPNFVMQPGQVCRVYTNQNQPQWCSFNYGSGSAIWNNTGDCATLRNSSNQQVDQYCY